MDNGKKPRAEDTVGRDAEAFPETEDLTIKEGPRGGIGEKGEKVPRCGTGSWG